MDEHLIADRLRARIDSWEAYVAKPAGDPVAGLAADAASAAAAGVPGLGSEPLPPPASLPTPLPTPLPPTPSPLPPSPSLLPGGAALVPVFSPGAHRDAETAAEAAADPRAHGAGADDHVADLRSALEQERERGQTLEQAMARQRFLYAMTLRAEHERTKPRPQNVIDVGPAAGPSRRGPSRMSARDAWAFLAALAALAFSIVYFLSAS